MPLRSGADRPLRGRPRAAVLLVSGCLLVAAWAGAADREPGTRAPREMVVAETAYEGKIGAGWRDDGWAPRATGEGPARLDLSGNGGWILSRPGLKGSFGGVAFRFQAPPHFGDFLEVRVDADTIEPFPRVQIGPQDRRSLPDGWTEVWIAVERLSPRGAPFDSLIIRAASAVEPEPVSIDGVVLTRNTPVAPPPPAAAPAPAPPAGKRSRGAPAKATPPSSPPTSAVPEAGRPAVATPAPGPLAAPVVAALPRGGPPPPLVSVTIDCSAPARPISPAVYGIAFNERLDAADAHQFQLGATARRFGGNSSTRFNWRLGHAWNSAGDWYFENLNYTGDPAWHWERFLEANRTHGLRTALTVPIMGWVAKDTQSYSFPVSSLGMQQSVDPWKPDAGNGLRPDGKPLPAPPPTTTSVAFSPEDAAEWVRTIRAADARRGARGVWMYVLDNEPMLWNSTHRDVHPEPTSYDELLDRTLRYGAAVRAADPEALIAGPALWGWPAYLGSAVDAKFGFTLRPDRRMHGDVPFLQWYLRKLAEHEKKTGQRLLDVVDVHFYAMGTGIGVGEKGATDPDTAARRLRATRALWDPTYVDESWIKEPVRLIPRLKEWIAQEYPGRGISIGEWSFGAEGHISGGLATAEALGRFGEQGITSAFYWTYPQKDSHAFWAFRAFRDFDGKGGRFQDLSVPATAPAPVSVFASRDEGRKRVVAVLLNLDPARTVEADLSLASCGTVARQRSFQHTASGRLAQVHSGDDPRGAVRQILPPYSMTVLDLAVEPPGGAR